MGGMRKDDLNFWCAGASLINKKLEPFGSEKRHVAAEDKIPLDGPIGGGGMLQRSDDAAEGAFAGPMIFNDFEFCVEVGVFLSTGDNCNF